MEMSFAKLAIVIGVTGLALVISVKKPLIGLLFFLALIFIRPQDDRPNLAELRLPFVASLGLLALYFRRAISTHQLFPQSNLVIPFVLFLLWMSLSAYLGVAPDVSFDKLGEFVVIAVVFMCILTFVENDADLRNVFAVIVFCGLIFVLYALFYGSDCIESRGGTACGRRNFAKININFGQPNYLGLTMVIMFNLTYAFLLTYKNILIRVSALILMLLFVLVLMLTGSRGAFLAFGASLIFYWYTGSRKLAGMLALGLIAVMIALAAPDQFISRMSTLGEVESDVSAMNRVELWKIGMDLTVRHPLTGVGLENFREFAPNTPHNAFVQVASEMGLPALIFFVWLLGRAFRGLQRARRGYAADDRTFLASSARVLVAAMIAIIVQSMTTGLAHRELLYIIVALVGVVSMLAKQVQSVDLENQDMDTREESAVLDSGQGNTEGPRDAG